MTKRIKNDSGVSKVWRGVVLADQATYDIPMAEWIAWSNDSVLLADIASGDAVVNNGTKDLNATDGKNYLQNIRVMDVRCTVKRDSSQSIPNNTNTNITFPTDVEDHYDMHDTVTNTDQVVISDDGLYFISGGAIYVGNTTGYRFIKITIDNAVTLPDGCRLETLSTTDAWQNTITKVEYLTSGTVVRLRTRQKSGGSLNILKASLSVVRIGL